MSIYRIRHLLELYRNNSANTEERVELASYVHRSEYKEVLLAYFAEKMNETTAPGWNDEKWEEMVQQILMTDKPARNCATEATVVPLSRRKWFRITAAACISFLFMAGGYFLLRRPNPKPMVHVAPKDVLPGKQGAVLTLADGTRVLLDSLNDGKVATQGNTTIMLKNKQLVYHSATGKKLMNTMSTPKARLFSLSLPDGTLVWLNAASSITYPTVFDDNERRVSVTGEVYFEVAKDKIRPFKVKTHAAEVEVLGTHFNINAYTDEINVKTTLLEGVVVLHTLTETARLQPGQQAQVDQKIIRVIKNADTEGALAWKNGKFSFQDKNIGEVMRQIGRWYDLDIAYEQVLPNLEFWGGMYRDVPLSDVLLFLEESGLKFNLSTDGKKLTVKKQS